MELQNPNLKNDMAGHLFSLRLLSVVFVVSILIYIGLVYSGQFARPAGTTVDNTLVSILLAVGMAEIIIAKPLAKFMRQTMKKGMSPQPHGSAPAKPKSSAIFSSTLVYLAITEAGALVGFVASFISGSLMPCLILGGFAILSILLNWPTEELFHTE